MNLQGVQDKFLPEVIPLICLPAFPALVNLTKAAQCSELLTFSKITSANLFLVKFEFSGHISWSLYLPVPLFSGRGKVLMI